MSNKLMTLTLDGISTEISVEIREIIPTYALSTVSSVDEGSSFTVTLTTTSVNDGTMIPYAITGISGDDIVQLLVGSFIVIGNTATAIIGVVADELTEGVETLVLSAAGESVSVIINDTSLTL